MGLLGASCKAAKGLLQTLVLGFGVCGKKLGLDLGCMAGAPSKPQPNSLKTMKATASEPEIESCDLACDRVDKTSKGVQRGDNNEAGSG